MLRGNRTVLGALVAAALFAFAVPALAQAPYSEATPTKKDPLRFSAFAVQMQGGRAVVIEIAIERWTTDAERNALVALVQTTTDKDADQRKLLKALQDIKVRAGFLNTPNSIGWDIKYAYESTLPDGSRQIVIVTDKPVSFAMAASGQAYDAAFSLIEIQFPKGSSKGVGKALARAGLSTKNGRLQIESYVNEPARLTEVTEAKPKVKK
jgi:hypothetical protein